MDIISRKETADDGGAWTFAVIIAMKMAETAEQKLRTEKKKLKQRKGWHPPSFAPSVVGTVTVVLASTATSENVV